MKSVNKKNTVSIVKKNKISVENENDAEKLLDNIFSSLDDKKTKFLAKKNPNNDFDKKNDLKLKVDDSKKNLQQEDDDVNLSKIDDKKTKFLAKKNPNNDFDKKNDLKLKVDDSKKNLQQEEDIMNQSRSINDDLSRDSGLVYGTALPKKIFTGSSNKYNIGQSKIELDALINHASAMNNDVRLNEQHNTKDIMIDKKKLMSSKERLLKLFESDESEDNNKVLTTKKEHNKLMNTDKNSSTSIMTGIKDVINDTDSYYNTDNNDEDIKEKKEMYSKINLHDFNNIIKDKLFVGDYLSIAFIPDDRLPALIKDNNNNNVLSPILLPRKLYNILFSIFK